jgi:hypothetical protein
MASSMHLLHDSLAIEGREWMWDFSYVKGRCRMARETEGGGGGSHRLEGVDGAVSRRHEWEG